ncbi:hypothetical protein ACQKWADRAFT_173775 [Trichoderma austrokoningii]
MGFDGGHRFCHVCCRSTALHPLYWQRCSALWPLSHPSSSGFRTAVFTPAILFFSFSSLLLLPFCCEQTVTIPLFSLLLPMLTRLSFSSNRTVSASTPQPMQICPYTY